MQRVVIVGAGHAAGQVVDSLRREEIDAEVTLVGEEAYVPYQRPPLSKKFLAGEMPQERLYLRKEAFYEQHGIRCISGVRADAIDRAAKHVTLSDGSTLSYDKLALTTGTRARPLPVPGADLIGVHYLRGIDDVRGIQANLDAAQNIVVVGAGFIGLEVAAVAAGMGKSVTVLEAMERAMQRVVAPIMSDYYETRHREHGVDVRVNAQVAEITGENGHATGLTLADGSTLATDLVIIGIGVIPNVELAEAAGLECDNGIVVDEFAVTSDPDIVSAGDCTNHPNRLLARRLRLESVHNAVEQAKTAAASLAGRQVAYEQIPWFWSDQYDLKLQMVGLSEGFDELAVRGDMDANKFSVLYFRDDTLIAADSVNAIADHMAARKLLAAAAPITPDQAADVETPLKTWLS